MSNYGVALYSSEFGGYLILILCLCQMRPESDRILKPPKMHQPDTGLFDDSGLVAS